MSGGFGALAGGAGAEGRAAEAEDEFERVKRLPEEHQREQELKTRKKETKRAAAAAAGGTTPAAKAATPANRGVEANPDAAGPAAVGLPTSFSGCYSTYECGSSCSSYSSCGGCSSCSRCTLQSGQGWSGVTLRPQLPTNV